MPNRHHLDFFPLILAISIILLFYIALYLRGRYVKRIEFEDMCNQAEDYISQADRTNIHHAIKASDMLGMVEARIGRNKLYKQAFDELLSVWKSKFLHLFPNNHKP